MDMAEATIREVMEAAMAEDTEVAMAAAVTTREAMGEATKVVTMVDMVAATAVAMADRADTTREDMVGNQQVSSATKLYPYSSGIDHCLISIRRLPCL